MEFNIDNIPVPDITPIGLFGRVLENLSDGAFSMYPSNAVEYMKYKTGINSPITEKELNKGDLDLLRKLAADKIKKGEESSGIGYKDLGWKESTILDDGLFQTGLKSMFDPSLRLATLLGMSNIDVDPYTGAVNITDTYDFNLGPKRKTYLDLLKQGKKKEAEEYISQFDSFEQEAIRAAKYNKNKKDVKIYLGNKDDKNFSGMFSSPK